jgi:hypothetical protein
VTRSLAPLRHRSFRFLVAGQFASNLGDACYAVALPWYVLAVALGAVVVHDLGPGPFFPIAAAALAAAILLGLSQRSWRQLGTTGASGRTSISQPCPAPATANGVNH